MRECLQKLTTGDDVRIQRNALQVLEMAPLEEGDDVEESADSNEMISRRKSESASFCSWVSLNSERAQPKLYRLFENTGAIQEERALKSKRKRVRAKKYSQMEHDESAEDALDNKEAGCRVNFHKLDIQTLRRYRKVFKISALDPNSSRQQLASACAKHFAQLVSQTLLCCSTIFSHSKVCRLLVWHKAGG